MALVAGWELFSHVFLIAFFTTILLPLMSMSDLKPQHGLLVLYFTEDQPGCRV